MPHTQLTWTRYAGIDAQPALVLPGQVTQDFWVWIGCVWIERHHATTRNALQDRQCRPFFRVSEAERLTCETIFGKRLLSLESKHQVGSKSLAVDGPSELGRNAMEGRRRDERHWPHVGERQVGRAKQLQGRTVAARESVSAASNSVESSGKDSPPSEITAGVGSKRGTQRSIAVRSALLNRGLPAGAAVEVNAKRRSPARPCGSRDTSRRLSPRMLFTG